MPGRLESAEGNGRPAVRCHFTNNEVDAQVDKRDAEKPFWWGWEGGLRNRQKSVLSAVFLTKNERGALFGPRAMSFSRGSRCREASRPAPGCQLPRERPSPPRCRPGSSRSWQGPILSPAVLFPVCVAALLLPGGHPGARPSLRLHPGTGSFPSSLPC